MTPDTTRAEDDGPELTVVVPVYCEAAHIEGELRAWSAALGALGIDYVLSVRDDGSNDGTREIVERLAAANSRIEVESHANRGHGPTVLEGYRRARGAWIFQVDGDGEIASDHFAALWEGREAQDLLIGVRRRRAQPLARRLVTAGAGAAVRLLFGPGIRDVNAPYRLMRASAMRPLFDRVPDDAFAPNVLLSGLALRGGLRVLCVDVPVRARASGRSSLVGARLRRGAWRGAWDVVRVAAATRLVR
jgi:glycosyltransferase involved in cell wall biosynthesis